MSKDKEVQGKLVKLLIALSGADIIAPEPLAKPVIDKVEGSDAWENLQIAVGNADEKSRKDLIFAVAAKFLKHTELIDLANAISSLGMEIMKYAMENSDSRKRPDEDALLSIFNGDTEE